MRDMIEDGIRRILQDQVTPGLLAASAKGEFASPLWHLLEEGGFTRALCRSAHGGCDASWSDLHPLLVASGWHCLPLPLPETLLACSLLEKAGIEPPDGPIGIADQPAGTPLSLQKLGDQWRLDGELAHVPWGRHCQHLVVQVPQGGEMWVVLLASEGLEIRHNLNLAREPRDTFLLRDARPLRVSRSPFAQPDPIRLYGALLRAAQTAGAARRTLEQAVQYAGERVQFGRPLAKFQAVQQQIAMAVSEVAAITAAAEHASDAAESGDPTCAVAIAKITAAEAAGKVAAVGHAVHGAIGYTAEHSLHHSTQRLWSWRSEFGNLRWWSQRLGLAVCARGADQAWNALIDGELEVLT